MRVAHNFQFPNDEDDCNRKSHAHQKDAVRQCPRVGTVVLRYGAAEHSQRVSERDNPDSRSAVSSLRFCRCRCARHERVSGSRNLGRVSISFAVAAVVRDLHETQKKHSCAAYCDQQSHDDSRGGWKVRDRHARFEENDCQRCETREKKQPKHQRKAAS